LTMEEQASEPEPRVERQVTSGDAEDYVSEEHIEFLRSGMPFFKDLSETEFRELLDKAKLLTYDPGDLIIRQGMPPTTFYVIKSGIAEMNVRSKFDDPITCPPNYLGASISQLKQFDYFGERALTTGEPYAASVRVLEKVRCFAFDVDDIPENSILSKQRRATEEMVQMLSSRYTLPDDYINPYPTSARDDRVLDLLVRFKQIRQAAQCFEYIMQSAPTWGDSGEIARRTALVNKLSPAQREEFQEVFNLVDSTHRGKISLLEMRKFMESARAEKSNEELLRMMAIANPRMMNSPDHGITRDEFMGVMAEAEFFNLFKETFQELDKDSTGYVRAGDLDEVLGGVRDLISDDQGIIIDVEDKDILVDYEQFVKMLIGAAL
jgi:calmodulin